MFCIRVRTKRQTDEMNNILLEHILRIAPYAGKLSMLQRLALNLSTAFSQFGETEKWANDKVITSLKGSRTEKTINSMMSNLYSFVNNSATRDLMKQPDATAVLSAAFNESVLEYFQPQPDHDYSQISPRATNFAQAVADFWNGIESEEQIDTAKNQLTLELLRQESKRDRIDHFQIVGEKSRNPKVSIYLDSLTIDEFKFIKSFSEECEKVTTLEELRKVDKDFQKMKPETRKRLISDKEGRQILEFFAKSYVERLGWWTIPGLVLGLVFGIISSGSVNAAASTGGNWSTLSGAVIGSVHATALLFNLFPRNGNSMKNKMGKHPIISSLLLTIILTGIFYMQFVWNHIIPFGQGWM